MRKHQRTAILIAATTAVLAHAGYAADATWNNAAANNLWGSANWATGANPAYVLQSGDAAFFDVAGAGTLSNDLVGATINGITFNATAGAFSLDGNGITLGGNVNNNMPTVAQLINMPLTLSATRTFSTVAGGTLTVNGLISGAGGFTRGGLGRVILTNANTYGGATTISGTGTTVLDYTAAGAAANNIMPATSALNFLTSSGTIVINGSAAGNNQSFASTTVPANTFAGISAISSGAAVNLNLGNFSRGNLSSVHFAVPTTGSVTATGLPAPVNGILGGWATINGNGFATTSGSQVVPYTGYTDVTSTIADGAGLTNVRVTAAGGVSATNASVNSLVFSTGLPTPAASTLNITGMLRVGVKGGLYHALPVGVNTGTLTISGGTLTAGGGATSTPGELYITAQGATGQIAILMNSVISDNGNSGTVTLVKSGNAPLRVQGANTYTGGTIINQGRLEVNGSGTVGTGPVFVQFGSQIWFNAAGPYVNELNLSGIGVPEGAIFRGTVRMNNTTNLTGPINAVTDARLMVRAATGTGTVSGQISGVGGMEFGSTNDGANSGTIVLIGTPGLNNYAGNTTITGSVVKLFKSEQIPNGAGKGNLIIQGTPSAAVFDLNGFAETVNGLSDLGTSATTIRSASATTLTLGDNNASGSFGGTFQDAISINKIGTGIQSFTGNVNHSGNTTVTGGTLSFGANASLNQSKVIDVKSGGNLNISLVNGGNFTVQSNQTLGGGGRVIGNTSMNDGNAVLAPGGLGATGTMSFSNNLTLGGGTIRMDLSNNTGSGNDVIQVDGNLSLNGTTAISINPISGNLAAGVYTLMKYTGTLTGTAAGNLGVPSNVRQTLALSNTTTTNGAVNLTVGSGSAMNLVWSGGNNSNAWDLNNTINFNTNTEKFFNWDSVTFNDTGSNSPDINLGNTLEPTNVTLANVTKPYVFAGGGNLINVTNLNKTAGGIATFSNGGANRFASVNISGGTLVFQNNSNTATLLTVNSGATLRVLNGSNGTFGGGNINSGASMFLNGTGTFSDVAIASGGTLTMGDGVNNGQGEINGSLANDGVMILNRPDDYDFKPNLSGSGTIRKLGTGKAEVQGASPNFTGQIDVVAGRVRANNTFTSLGSTSAGTIVISNGAQLDIGGLVGASLANGFGTRLIKVEGAGVNDEGALHNTGTAQINAYQRVQLTNNATFNANAGGRYDVRAAQIAGVNQATLDLGGFTLTKKGDMQFGVVATDVSDGTIIINQGTFAAETTTNIPAGNGQIVMAGNDTRFQVFGTTGNITRTVRVEGQGVQFGTGNTANASVVAPPIIINNDVIFTAFGGAGTVTWNGPISQVAGQPRQVTKEGTSAVIFGGANTYAGNTQVNNGTLRVNGTHVGGGDYNVSGSATFGGSGTISSRINMSGNSNLTPGASIGTLTVGTLALDGANLQYEIDGGAVDKTVVTSSNGLILPGGTNPFTFISATPAAVLNGTYTLIDYSGTALTDLTRFSISNPTLGPLSFTLVNNTANTSVDLTVTGGLSIVTSAWNVDANGNWSLGSNWTAGAPNSIDATANFGNKITAARTVTVDAPQTVGSINFDNANSYTVAGASAITMDVSTGSAQINVISGNHTISAPVTLNDNLVVTSAASTGVALTGNLTATGKTVTKAGAGTVQFENVRAAGLAVNVGSAKISTKGTNNASAGTSVVSSLTIAAGSSLDLTNNSMIVDYTGASVQNDIRLHLLNNRLTTSTATPTGVKLGYAESSAILGAGGGTFAGQPADGTAVLVKFTYGGDATLDGQVDVLDLGKLASSWQQPGVWNNGDFDYSGLVDVLDLGILATNWQKGVGSPLGQGSFEAALQSLGLGSAAVPEPASLGLMTLGLTGLAARRRRR